jgi:hypothetical protein
MWYRGAEMQLVHFSLFNASVCQAPAPQFQQALGPECPLLARKFGPETADTVTEVVRTSHVLRDFQLAQWG